MNIEEINRKYGDYEGNILKRCGTKYIGTFYVPQSEPCDIWWDWESKVRYLIFKYMKPNSIFLDAGANLGYFSLLAATIINEGGIHAVEANPFIFEVLTENARQHGLNNFCAYNAALSDGASSELEFYWRLGANGNGRSYDPREHDGNQWMTHTVKNMSLNSFADSGLSIIKMDIEGAEYDVLQNSDEFFRQNGQVKVILELHHTYIKEQVGITRYNTFIKYLDNRFDSIEPSDTNFLCITPKRRKDDQ